MTDNAPQFTSGEFADFIEGNEIVCTPPPYHPYSNGPAERAVQTFKQGLSCLTEDSLETRPSTFLLDYSPAELLLGTQPRSRVDLLHPDTTSAREKSQVKQERNWDTTSTQELQVSM